MPYNGTGTFNQLYNFNTEASSPPIEISKLQAECEDMASALSNCITRDGQGKPTANQDFNGKNLTNVGTLSANTVTSLGTMSCVGVFQSTAGIAGTTIGASGTASTGAFTTLTSSGATTLGATSATSIDSTPIGATTASSGRFTTVTATSGGISATGTITAPNFNGAIGAVSPNTGAFTTLSATGTTTLAATTLGATTATSINSTPIGATTRSTGAFTTLSSNSTTTLGATTATSINSTPIGATTPSTGAFTSFSANGPAVFTNFVSVNSTLNATALENTPIGNTTRAAGSFTTLSSNNTTTLGATTATSINNTPIGATTASTGRFTTLNTTSTANLDGQLNANGEVVFAKDPTFPSQTGFKNILINGNMVVSNRTNFAGGTVSIATGTTKYVTDRWYVKSSGSTVVGSRASSSSDYFWYELAVTGSTGNTNTTIGQRIESLNAVALPNRKVMVSFYIKRSSGTSINVNLYRATGTDGWGAPVLLETQSINPTSTLTQYVLYFNTLPNISYQGISIEFNCGALPSGDSIGITGVQLEVCNSSIAIPQFEYRPVQYEEMLCARYCRLLTDAQNSGGTATSATQLQTRYIFNGVMRATPTISLISNGTYFISDDYSADFNTTTTTLVNSNMYTSGGRIQLGGFTGLTAGRFYATGTTNGTARIIAESEL
jgi:hypothetical protein